MTAPDLCQRGLDPAHILSVASQAIRDGHGLAFRAVTAPGGMRVHLSSRLAAGDAAQALGRVGYQVAQVEGSGHRDLLVTGWSANGLESRLAALRAVLHRLNEDPGSTAAVVIERARRLPARSAAHPDTSVLADARAQLQAWVGACSGINAPRNPTILPADTGNALRLRLTQSLEAAIDDLVKRHLQVAWHALSLFQSLGQHMAEPQAGELALHRASVAFHPGTASPVSPAPAQRPAQTRETESRPPGPGRSGQLLSGPTRPAGSGFISAVPGAIPGAVPAARPVGGRFPAHRPGYPR